MAQRAALDLTDGESAEGIDIASGSDAEAERYDRAEPPAEDGAHR